MFKLHGVLYIKMKIKHPFKDTEFNFDNLLHENLMAFKDRVFMDKDVVGLVVGVPGVGKSTITTQCLYVLNGNTDVNAIKWKYEDYMRHCDKLFKKNKSRGAGIIHDDSRGDINSASVLNRKVKHFMNFLYENRQMNMYQFLLQGNFFDFPKSIVMERAMFLIYVREGDKFENGNFKFYNRADLKMLYIKGKKENNMNAWQTHDAFTGRFDNVYCVDEAKYREIKKDSLDIKRFIDEPKKDKGLNDTTVCRYLIKKNPLAYPTGLDRWINKSTVSRVWKEIKDGNEVDVDVENNDNIVTAANVKIELQRLRGNEDEN